jgi:hypothetical protein
MNLGCERVVCPLPSLLKLGCCRRWHERGREREGERERERERRNRAQKDIAQSDVNSAEEKEEEEEKKNKCCWK